jgi:uncharacterized protein YggL (DUF469 family)
MNKRIRKKKHLGEFRQLGFHVAARYLASVSEEQLDKLDESLILFVESRDLTIGGGVGVEPSAFITRAWCRKNSCHKHPLGAKRNAQVTDVDREAIELWFKAQGAIDSKAGPLIDANYSSEAESDAAMPTL